MGKRVMPKLKLNFNTKKLILFSFFFLLILIPLISAQQTKTQQNVNVNVGLSIEFTKIDTFENGKFHLFNAHVVNISTGLQITNETAGCMFHLFDNTGNHIINGEPMVYETAGMDWQFNVTGGNFTRNGEYSYLIVCNTTNIGNFISVGFDVTPTGKELTTADSILIIVLTAGVFFMFLFAFWGGLMLPFRNRRNDASEIVEIEKLKYFKIILLTLSYTLLVWLSNLLFAISNNFSLLSQMTGFFRMTFQILFGFSYVVFVVTLIFMFVLAWRDLKLRQLLTRGLPAR